jgi:hypothetical protein
LVGRASLPVIFVGRASLPVIDPAFRGVPPTLFGPRGEKTGTEAGATKAGIVAVNTTLDLRKAVPNPLIHPFRLSFPSFPKNDP